MTPVIGTSMRASGSSSSEPGRGAPGGCGGSDPTTSNEGFGCGPVQPDGSGPAGAGRGPYCGRRGRRAARRASRAGTRPRPRRAPPGTPRRRRRRRGTSGSASTRASRPYARTIRSTADDALRVGEEEPVAARRERAGEAVEGHQGAVARRGLDLLAIGGRVAVRLVDREALVQPVRRVVVRVVDARPGRRRGSARAERRSRPSSRRSRPGVIRANSVRMSGWASPPTFSRVRRAEGVVERALVGVDEEVDRLGLRHAEQRRRRLRRRRRRSSGRARRTPGCPRPSGPGRRPLPASSSRSGRRRRSG